LHAMQFRAALDAQVMPGRPAQRPYWSDRD
jgi:hypothetical protein